MNKYTAGSVALCLAMLSATPALADNGSGFGSHSNFSYTLISIDVGKATPDQDIVFYGERYEEFGAASLSGAYQLDNNLAVSVGASAIANSGSRTEITNSSVAVKLLVPIPVGSRLDIVPNFGFGKFKSEFCIDNNCMSQDDSAALYGIGLRAWVLPNAFELNGGVSDSTLENSETTVAIGAALWANENHRFALDYEGSSSLSVVTIGYSYNW